MRVGAHVSASGGISKVIDRAVDIGAETVQVFASSPRTWKFREPTEDQVQIFREKSLQMDISPIFIHGSYLVNVGGGPELLNKSIDSLVRNMETADRIGAAGVIFHGGSHKGVGFDRILLQAANALKDVMSHSPFNSLLIIENSAGMGSHIGASFEEIADIIEAVDSPKLKVCLDTQHSVAAGYDLTTIAGVEEAMDKFNSLIGISKLAVVHANDSKIRLHGGIDRHENIGEGHIGIKGFEAIMSHSAFHEIPFILEVPGHEKTGPDKENIDRLKDLRASLQINP